MANADVFSKAAPATPPSVNGITFAFDSVTGMWKGTGLDTTVAAMTFAGSPFYSTNEITRFKGDKDALTAKIAALATLQTTVDAAAAALALDPLNGTLITALATASNNVVEATDFLTAAQAAIAEKYLGKPNPFA